MRFHDIGHLVNVAFNISFRVRKPDATATVIPNIVPIEPKLGEDTVEVLTELRCSPDDTDALDRRGVI
ncbi:MAG TPA: hypothetical protein VLA54_04190 [Acidimicrobiia bacterium]|nr:hypothetical protein [Acidimicrobiia bacterium]